MLVKHDANPRNPMFVLEAQRDDPQADRTDGDTNEVTRGARQCNAGAASYDAQTRSKEGSGINAMKSSDSPRLLIIPIDRIVELRSGRSILTAGARRHPCSNSNSKWKDVNQKV
jgi:hypothetical protein